MKWACLCLLLLAAPISTRAQAGGDTGLQTLLHELPGPARVADLDATWRQVVLAATPDPEPTGSGMMGFYAQADAQTIWTSLCYTQGRAISMGGRTYLVTYRPVPPMDWVGVFRGFETNPARGTELITDMLMPRVRPDTPVALWLVDVGRVRELRAPGPVSSTNMRIVRPAGAQSSIMAAILFPVFAQARARARAVSSIGNLRQLALAAAMYEADENRLPPMAAAASARKALLPYTKNEALFRDPVSGEPYRFNAALSRKKLASIRKPAETVLIYAPKPDTNLRRAVAFVDGHAKLVSVGEWARLRRVSGIP